MRRSLAPSQSSMTKKSKFLPVFSSVKSSQPRTKTEINENSPEARLPIPKTNSFPIRSSLDVLKLLGKTDVTFDEAHINAKQTDQCSVLEQCDDVILNSNEEEMSSTENESFIPNKEFKENSIKVLDNKENYFKVVWCKRSTRKHKKWEGDAVLVVKKKSVVLKDMNGKSIGTALGYKQSELEKLEIGSQLFVGGKEIEVLDIVTEKEYGSGACFLTKNQDMLQTSNLNDNIVTKLKPFRTPCKFNTLTKKSITFSGTPRYNPLQLGALVMPRPCSSHQYQNAENVVDVVVDPALSNKLRQHQKEGVIFLYECITQIRNFNGQGAILADEMGLGKTLQCITLIWTVLKQGPYGGCPIVKRVLIIVPSSLMKNWFKEFNMWLGKERLRICLANQIDKIEVYLKSPMEPVLITSYELAMRHHELLEKLKFDLMICDEGHRLKNTNTKTSTYLGQLSIKRRIALTGTPIQNDLQEFYSLVDFVNPGILSSLGCFKKVYEEPIVQSKQPAASKDEIILGEMRSLELSRLTSQFILRRTQDVNNEYLPEKSDYVVFCKASPLQVNLYNKVLSSRWIKSCLTGTCKESSFHLICISCLKKLCNHPALIYKAAKEVSELPSELADDSPYEGLYPWFPDGFNKFVVPPTEFSGKLMALEAILIHIKFLEPKERVVLVSNSTKTLDMLEGMCKLSKHTYCRLDGTTPNNNRQDIVDRFNAPYSDTFIFLLSSKAGGVGLNLVGASRLILYDIDWNPANDLQAMSRVWRDGQKKHVHIYRLITTGTIEEKIYQRQITKHSLTTVLAKVSHKKMQFTLDELKDLFTFNGNSQCCTHDLMGCDCNTLTSTASTTAPQSKPSENSLIRSAQLTTEKTWNKSMNLAIDEFMSWKHISGNDIGKHENFKKK